MMEPLRKLVSTSGGNAALVALCSFLVYLKTMAPSVDFIDSGELVSVASTLGIAHPTGYPLFTLLGWVFSRLPVAAEEVARMNIMAAFFCSVGVFFFYHLVHRVLSQAVERLPIFKRVPKNSTPAALRASSAGAALLLAFSETYWSQAVAVEVYSLHVMFLSLVVYTFLRANDGDARGRSWWYIFAFVLGLAFTNHMTTILLAPGLLYLYFSTQGSNAVSWRRIGLMAFPFILGLSFYLYLPIRAAQGPSMNWGNPVTLERFLWHFSGKQYRVWIFSSTEAAGRQLKYFMDALPAEFAFVGSLLSALGLWVLDRKVAIAFALFFTLCLCASVFGLLPMEFVYFALVLFLMGLWLLRKGSQKLAIFSVLLFLACLFYSINYDIHDIDSYFLLAYFTMAAVSGVALLLLCLWMGQMWTTGSAVTAVIVLSLAPLVFHIKTNDRSDHHLVEDYTMNMFASLQPNAFVLSYQWDFWVSASYYYQLVRNYRTDVVVVDKELLRRSWYIASLEKRYPWLIRQSRGEVDAFLKELDKFEHDLPYHANVIEARYTEMIRSFIEQSRRDRPVYATGEIEPQYIQGYQSVPEGLALRLEVDTLFHPTVFPAYTYRPYRKTGIYEDKIRTFYAASLTARGEYYLSRGRDQVEAKRAFSAALQYVPDYPRALAWIKRYAR